MYSITVDHYNHREVQAFSSQEKEAYQKFVTTIQGEDLLQTRTFKEQVFVNQIVANIEFLLNLDIKKKTHLLKMNLDLFDQQPHFIEAHPRYYFATLYNYLNACCNIHQFENVDQGIIKIKDFVAQHSSLRRNLLFVYFLEIRSAYLQSKFKEISTKLEPKIQAHIKKYQQETDFLTAQIYNIFVHNYFTLQNPQRWHFYLRRFQIIAKQLDSAYDQYAQLLELIGHFDTNDFLLIEKMINSFKRKNKKKKTKSYTPFFLSFLELIEQVIKSNNNQSEVEQFAKSFQQKCKDLKSDPVMNLMQEYTLEVWLEMLQKGRTFSEIKRIR